MSDAIVIGGGIVGASTAYHLAAGGVETLLIDRRDEGRATDAGAGIVSPESSRHASEAWYAFAVEAARYYPELVADLGAAGVEETGYARPGVLVVDLPDHEREPFVRGRERVYERRARTGHPPDDRLYDVTPSEASGLFPALADVRDAFYYEDGARVDGRTFEDALLRAGVGHGLDTLDASAEGIVVDGGAVTGVVADGEPRPTEAVVVAGGAWSGAFGDQLGIRIPVEPQRGQIVHLDAARDTADWPIVSTVQGHYLVPWEDGRVAAGATRETGSGFAPYPTAAGVRGVLDDALRTAPGLGDAAVGEVRVGLRPLSDDGLPVIGAVPAVDGAYLATGHGPTGLTLGPYTGKCVADLVRGEEVAADLSAFAPGRFG